jgi:hypothetical protein
LIESLPSAVGFVGDFFKCADLPSFPAEPDEEDFENDQDYEQACEFYFGHQFDPKPWLLTSTSSEEILEIARSSMKWTINNKTYLVAKGTPNERNVAFSRDSQEKAEIAKQEFHHQEHVEGFLRVIKSVVSGNQCWLHETNHVLDILNPPSENAAEAFEGCFFDRLLAITTQSCIVLIWIGHLRWYG